MEPEQQQQRVCERCAYWVQYRKGTASGVCWVEWNEKDTMANDTCAKWTRQQNAELPM
jgi:hypothetical protein